LPDDRELLPGSDALIGNVNSNDSLGGFSYIYGTHTPGSASATSC
jgi:hypothetical protein